MRTLILGVSALAIAVTAFGCSASREADDTGVSDGGPALDPTGTWDDCDTRWTFAPDGTTTRREIARGCTAEGRWSVEGNRAHIEWDTSCEGDAAIVDGTIAFGVGSLSILFDGTSRAATFAASGTPIETFTLIDEVDPSLRTIVRLVGDPELSAGNGCYWAEDGACGGLLSCTGRILQWRAADEEVEGARVASTACTGDCPCGAVLNLTPTDEGFDVAYQGVNCGGTFAGSARALPRSE